MTVMTQQYRIKTEQEFVDEYGKNWREGHGQFYYFLPRMDKYLGVPLVDVIGDEQEKRSYEYGNTKEGDAIQTWMITEKPLPITSLADEYCVEVEKNSNEAKELARWLNENTLVNGHDCDTFRGNNNIYSICKDGSSWATDKVYQRIPFQTWKKLMDMEKREKKIVGYKIIVPSPGYNNMGEIIPTGKSNYYDSWPHLFEPVYEQEKEVLTLRCEGGTFEVEVSADGIYYNNSRVTHNPFILDIATNEANINIGIEDYSVYISHINIGCKSLIPVEDIAKVWETYKKFKK